MQTTKMGSVTTLALFTAMTITVPLSAQQKPGGQTHHQYKLIDLGTFGGPAGLVPGFSLVSINSKGTVIVQGDTTIPDPYSPNCFWGDCLVNHVGIWRDGVLTDLGTLPGVTSGQPLWINEQGVVVGVSENGRIDPLNGVPEIDAVVWKDGHVTDLGTLGGYASAAQAINNRGEVTGLAFNPIPDPYQQYMGPAPNLWANGSTQMHAFLWRDGAMRDLGTLGGPDSVGEFVNERGQVAGVSYTSFTPNLNTGIPTQDPFLWDKGTMIDLGTLGGTGGWPWGLNNKGQVTGQSNLADDVNFHAFLWEGGVMKDLGTLGGNKSSSRWINEAGEIVGRADIPGSQTRHGFLWRKGVMTDLGVVDNDPCSTAYSINSSSQIIGISAVCGQTGHGFLWENGGPIVDLQTLVLPGSNVTIQQVYFISDAGEIAGSGVDSNGNQRPILLVPCDEKHAGVCKM